MSFGDMLDYSHSISFLTDVFYLLQAVILQPNIASPITLRVYMYACWCFLHSVFLLYMFPVFDLYLLKIGRSTQKQKYQPSLYQSWIQLFRKIAILSYLKAVTMGARVIVHKLGHLPCTWPAKVQSPTSHIILQAPPEVIPECRARNKSRPLPRVPPQIHPCEKEEENCYVTLLRDAGRTRSIENML